MLFFYRLMNVQVTQLRKTKKIYGLHIEFKQLILVKIHITKTQRNKCVYNKNKMSKLLNDLK